MVNIIGKKSNLLQTVIESLDEANPKACIITTNYPPYPENGPSFRGGISEELTELVDNLNKKRIPCIVISLSLFGSSPEHPQVKRVGKYVPYTVSKVRKILFPAYEFFNPIIFLRMVNVLMKEKPSVVLIGETYQMSTAPHLACITLGIKRIVSFDWICPSYPTKGACTIKERIERCGNCLLPSGNIILKYVAGIFSSFMYLIKKRLWNSAFKITIQSDYHAYLFKSWGLDVKKFVLAPPVSTITEDDEYTANLLKVKGDGVALCYIGRLTKEKGFDLLLEAFRMCTTKTDKKIKLFVAGAGPLREDRDNVEYLGWVTKDKLGSVYRIADLIVVPTIVAEIHPAVVDNALEYEKRIIAFKVGSLKEIIGDRGILIEEISEEKLADAICENL
jgi:glycosyltransferase involved in cell wall biosynthesis